MITKKIHLLILLVGAFTSVQVMGMCKSDLFDVEYANIPAQQSVKKYYFKKELKTAIQNEDTVTLARYITDSALASARDDCKETLLHKAAQLGSVKAIELFLSRGARPNAISAAGLTPLHEAARRVHPKHVDALKVLLAAKACTLVEDLKGNTPLHYAVEHNHTMVQDLLNAGAFINAQNNEGQTPLDVAIARDANKYPSTDLSDVIDTLRASGAVSGADLK